VRVYVDHKVEEKKGPVNDPIAAICASKSALIIGMIV